MELSEALLKRRSVRKFTGEPVSGEQISGLLHAAMSGPSACNRRPWEFYVVTRPEVLEKLRAVSPYSRMEAPLAIVVAGNLSRALPLKLASYWIQDCSAAAENILLRAVDLGLGAVWCGLHPQERAEKRAAAALELPPKQIPLGLLWIGHPAESPAPRDQYSDKNVHLIR